MKYALVSVILMFCLLAAGTTAQASATDWYIGVNASSPNDMHGGIAAIIGAMSDATDGVDTYYNEDIETDFYDEHTVKFANLTRPGETYDI